MSVISCNAQVFLLDCFHSNVARGVTHLATTTAGDFEVKRAWRISYFILPSMVYAQKPVPLLGRDSLGGTNVGGILKFRKKRGGVVLNLAAVPHFLHQSPQENVCPATSWKHKCVAWPFSQTPFSACLWTV